MLLSDKIVKQTGQSINNNNIKIKDLDKGILRVRYSNNRKLSKKLLKDDYRISKRMINAIEFNKDIHKLSPNEKNIYYELQKFLNKEQDINVLIGSYLSGNFSKSLFNKINKMLYNKLKDNLISKNYNYEYNEFLTDIDLESQIGQQVTYKNNHIYIRKNILNSEFNYIEICIKDQNNKPVKMTDLFKIRVYIS